ncbi:DNA-binding transcriptional regulator GalS|nr:DNA-binding transcriptional regulator GalS [Candidatus Pantoea persica]
MATLSRMLNSSSAVAADTRDAVLQAVESLGYRPNANAQALATQVSDTIGAVGMSVSEPFWVRRSKRSIPWRSACINMC